MRKQLLILGLVFLFISCENKQEKIKIEKFVWIQHNQNWIWNPADLQARFYLEFLSSSNKIRLAKTDLELNNSEYFTANATDSLRDLIINNLYSKEFPNDFEKKDSYHYIYDGDFYCIIYKFSNGTERIMNYKPYTIPDSLKTFTNYLENLARMNSWVKTNSFDRTSLVNKYRDLIIGKGPLAPPPPKKTIKFPLPTVDRNN